MTRWRARAVLIELIEWFERRRGRSAPANASEISPSVLCVSLREDKEDPDEWTDEIDLHGAAEHFSGDHKSERISKMECKSRRKGDRPRDMTGSRKWGSS